MAGSRHHAHLNNARASLMPEYILREVAALDFVAKRVAATRRISSHCFNTEDEFDRPMEILERLTL